MKCRYCKKECKNENSLRNHERLCKMNPNRQISAFVEYNKNKIVWNKGLTKEIDERVKKQSETLKNKYDSGELIHYNKDKKTSDEVKKKISKSIKLFLLNNPDKVPYLLNHSSKISYPEQYFIKLFEKENINLKYHLQIGLYQLDFYNEELKKYIEIDGEQHYLQKNIDKDIIRTEYLKNLGWVGMRIRWAEYKKMTNLEKNELINNIRYFLTN